MIEEENEDLDVFVEDVLEEKKYLISVKQKTKCKDLKKIFEELFETKYYEFRFKDKLYTDEQILTFEQGDNILFYKKPEPEKEKVPKKDELKEDINIKTFSGILRLFLVKFIADKISDLGRIENKDILDIILDLKYIFELLIDKNDQNLVIKIKEDSKEQFKYNIIYYLEIFSLKIDEEKINYLIKLLDEPTKKEVFLFSNKLSLYENYISFFEKELSEALKNSYFEYQINLIQLLPIENNKDYLEQSKICKNKETRYLFHEIRKNNKILYYSKKPFFGMGIYFTDKLDYIAYKTSKINIPNKNLEKILINDNFFCNISQIYYDTTLKKEITDLKYSIKQLDKFPTYDEINKKFIDKKVKKNGVHIAKIKSDSRQLITQKDIETKLEKGQFITNEYIITEKEQILSLFNLRIEINDYLVIYRDQNFNNKKINYALHNKLFKEYISKECKINIYFVISIEEALEIIKRKRHNKIILITNIGQDLSGKKLIEIARKILGFPILALFNSLNTDHLSWIQNFKNSLFINDNLLIKNYIEYIKNNNIEGLLQLKEKVEKDNNIKLTFTDNFISYPNYFYNKYFNDILFEEICSNFKKVIIKNIQNSNALYLDNNNIVCFKKYSDEIIDKNQYIWTITILENQITLFSHNYYLTTSDKNLGTKEYMENWNFEIHDNYYLIYHQDKNKILTDENNKAIVNEQKDKNHNQLFSLIEINN